MPHNFYTTHQVNTESNRGGMCVRSNIRTTNNQRDSNVLLVGLALLPLCVYDQSNTENTDSVQTASFSHQIQYIQQLYKLYRSNFNFKYRRTSMGEYRMNNLS